MKALTIVLKSVKIKTFIFQIENNVLKIYHKYKRHSLIEKIVLG